MAFKPSCCQLLGGSWGLSKWVGNGDTWGHSMPLPDPPRYWLLVETGGMDPRSHISTTMMTFIVIVTFDYGPLGGLGK